MNFKVEKINEYLVKNDLVANGRVVEGDPRHTMIVSVDSVHDFGFYLFISDEPIIGCKCVIAGDVDPETPGLLLLLNKLSNRYKTHSYCIEDKLLCAKFPMYFKDDTFDADDLFGYCSLVDYHIAKDVLEIFKLLGREVPEVVVNDKKDEKTITETAPEQGQSVADKPAEEVAPALMDIQIPSGSVLPERGNEVNNID